MARTETTAGLSISDVAAETGISNHTLRYYERAGLLAGVDRNGSGHRRYSAADVAWIVMVTRLRATGMPIRLIRRYAELVRAGEGNEAERLALLEAHREAVVASLSELRRNLELIDHKVALYRAQCAPARRARRDRPLIEPRALPRFGPLTTLEPSQLVRLGWCNAGNDRLPWVIG